MRFVNIRSFDNYIPAHIAMGRLLEEYVNCYLQDENSVTIDPFLSNAIGGIKLMVAEAQAERALELLNQDNLPPEGSLGLPS
jgi:Putative prokaryotic signal transducing protein